MATITDVAAYILHEYGPMTTMKLQKLAFYAQAESLSRHGAPLFDEDFQAWRGGPVCTALYAKHRGKFIIRDGELPVIPGMPNGDERTIIDAVCSVLAAQTGNQLSTRTHSEEPWLVARSGLPASASCSTVISKSSMATYYKANPVIPSGTV
ncbi:Panacea domain-containing protein [Bifidobacterium aerophilum]|uniref:DUF4065 domain-containing protein n=1 Tax=Bifidobacterium aerophilum TaxID=1798155 RepID=A0A6N9Z1R6_9BIFI|nr:type II toxin-antitoxin system antitoxin SocA domain-containing protein [Bifidobacterium aerophilum]NEG88508.1 DUF4065 domain-containing protein [Bifidobacterium aerophilum]